MLRGQYDALSFAVYGNAAEEFVPKDEKSQKMEDIAAAAAAAKAVADEADNDLPLPLRYLAMCKNSPPCA